MRFTWTTIRVRDLDKSLAFYHDLLGLPVQERFALPAMKSPCWALKRAPSWSCSVRGNPCPSPLLLAFHGLCPGEYGQLLADLKNARDPRFPTHVPQPHLAVLLHSGPRWLRRPTGGRTGSLTTSLSKEGTGALACAFFACLLTMSNIENIIQIELSIFENRG